MAKRIFSEEHKRNLSISHKGQIVSEETRNRLRAVAITNGEYGLRNKQSVLRKQECIFGCKNAKKYYLHHEPPLTSKNAKEWNGRLINLCGSCHKRYHLNSITIPPNLGIEWTIEQTNEYFGV